MTLPTAYAPNEARRYAPMLTPSPRRRCAIGRPKKMKNTIGKTRLVTLKAGTRQRIRSSLLVWARSIFSNGAARSEERRVGKECRSRAEADEARKKRKSI